MTNEKLRHIFVKALHTASWLFVICGVIINVGLDDKIAELTGFVSMILGVLFYHHAEIYELRKKVEKLDDII